MSSVPARTVHPTPAAAGHRMRAPYVFLAVAAGSLLPIQFALNSQVAHHSHSIVFAAGLSYFVGVAALSTALLTRRLEPINWRNLRHAPWWSFLGGLVGSGYVLSSVYLTAALGTGLAISLIITVQTITSLTVDHFGLLGFPRRPLTRPRIAAALLMLIAVTLQVPR